MFVSKFDQSRFFSSWATNAMRIIPNPAAGDFSLRADFNELPVDRKVLSSEMNKTSGSFRAVDAGADPCTKSDTVDKVTSVEDH